MGEGREGSGGVGRDSRGQQGQQQIDLCSYLGSSRLHVREQVVSELAAANAPSCCSFLPAGESPPGLSKEIASALSHVPGFEMDPFSLDDSLRMDPLALDMLEGDLMLADPAVEDSFRSDRFQ